LKNIYVDQIQERDRVEAPFLVRDKIIGMAKNGRPYMTLKLMDRTGEVEGRIWDRVDEISALFGKDDFVRVAGKASVYMGKMQLVIHDLARLDEAKVDLSDFLPVSVRPVAEMTKELAALVESLGDNHLRALMQAFLADAEFMAGYSRAPAAKAMHHVYLGGLLEHSLAVAALADNIAKLYPDINRDLLLVGALLHDVGKVVELRYRRSFEYTDVGKLLGHIVIGVELIEEKIKDISGFPEGLKVLLKHMLLSHHGQYEYGSPKRPKTVEAIILNFIDDLDSKINGVRTHIEKEPDSDSAWTRYHRLYDRYFLKGGLDGGGGQEPPVVNDGVVSEAIVSEAQVNEAQVSETTPKPAEAAPSRARFGNSMGEKLQGINLDLFGAEKQDENNE